MQTILSLMVAALGLGFLVLVHEFGHFLAAKSFGIRVEEFSIGFGRFLWSVRKGETVYGISTLPLGGYVRVTGMHQEEFQARVDAVREQQAGTEVEPVRDLESRMSGAPILTDAEIIETPPERRFYTQPLWKKSIFIVAGVTMNLVAAVVLMTIVGLQGYVEPTTRLETVEAGSPAAVAGLRAGDKVLSIAGTSVDSWASMQEGIRANPAKQVPVVVERNGAEVTLQPTLGDKEGVGYLGVSPQTQEVQRGLLPSLRYGAEQTWLFATLFFRGVGEMISGKTPVVGPQGGLSGPVGIVSVSSEAVRGGFFLALLAFISVQLAIFNMLPLLPLDGGHLLFAVLEKVTHRTISLRTFERVSLLGIGLFLLLALVATSNDIGRLLSGNPGF